jgi:hypothetical protein
VVVGFLDQIHGNGRIQLLWSWGCMRETLYINSRLLYGSNALLSYIVDPRRDTVFWRCSGETTKAFPIIIDLLNRVILGSFLNGGKLIMLFKIAYRGLYKPRSTTDVKIDTDAR